MTSLRAIGAILLTMFALAVVVANWTCVVAGEVNRRRGIDKHHSTVPLLSLMAAALAFFLCPFTPRGWIWVIPVIDIANWLVLIGLPWAVFTGMFKKD